MLPNWIVLDELLTDWLREDIGRGDKTTDGLAELTRTQGKAYWVAKEDGVIAGLPIAERVFSLLGGDVMFEAEVAEGDRIQKGTRIADISCQLSTLLTGERVALNLAMSLSGIATMTRQYADVIADLPTQLVDTRKTTPGMRLTGEVRSFCRRGTESSDGIR